MTHEALKVVSIWVGRRKQHFEGAFVSCAAVYRFLQTLQCNVAVYVVGRFVIDIRQEFLFSQSFLSFCVLSFYILTTSLVLVSIIRSRHMEELGCSGGGFSTIARSLPPPYAPRAESSVVTSLPPRPSECGQETAV